MPYLRTDAPIPEDKPRGKPASKFVFDKLDVGHSFFLGDKANVPAGEKAEDCSTQAVISTMISKRNRA